jgi:hypothetical protein
MGLITVIHRDDPTLLYSARDPYVERYWLPWFGPTALVLLRRLALDALSLPSVPDGAAMFDVSSVYDVEHLAACVGVKGTILLGTLRRLVRFDRAREVDETTWEVDVRVPAVDPKHYRRLPDGYADELAWTTP